VLKVGPFEIAAPAKPAQLLIGIASDASGPDRLIPRRPNEQAAEVST
jgi:hypothetical protein